MGDIWTELLIGLGLLLVVEGLLYAGFPGLVRAMAREALNRDDGFLRSLGIIAMIIGIALVWLVRRILN